MTTCPHGDIYCPCQEGAACHFEGVAALPSPRPGVRYMSQAVVTDSGVTAAHSRSSEADERLETAAFSAETRRRALDSETADNRRMSPVPALDVPPLSIWKMDAADQCAVTMSRIVEAVSELYGLTPSQVRGRDRSALEARCEAIRRCHATGLFSTPQIGRYFGGRDHSTVIHLLHRERREVAA